MHLIVHDYEKCLSIIQEIMGEASTKRRVSLLENKKLRNPALKALHNIQLKDIEAWRNLKDNNEKQSETHLLKLLLLVNALAGGLKSTG